MSDTFTIHTDGGSRGNPGPAAFAYTIERPGAAIIEENGYLGDTTNNIAEYTALVKALEHAVRLGATSVVVNSDSELMVQQMNGKYKVKNPGIQPLYQEAVRLAKSVGDVRIRHIYREHNSRADRLCNEALDDRHNRPIIESLTKNAAAPVAAKPTVPVAKADDGRIAALKVLKDARQAWTDDEDDAPSPEQVLEKLERLLK